MSSNDVIARLDAAVRALGEVDVFALPDDALRDHLSELSSALCQVDAHLARLADAVRSRGYSIIEESLAADRVAA
jgi:hypothetical protein